MNSPDTIQELQLRFANRFSSNRDVNWHTHEETELVVVTKGRCRVLVGDQHLEGARGAVFVLPARVAQYQETLGTTCTTFLGIDLPSDYFDESPRVLVFDPKDPILQWIEQLCDGYQARPPFSKRVVRSMLMAILSRLGDIDEATGSQARLHPVVRAARAYLETQLQQTPTLPMLAKAVGSSVSHLSALFAHQCGVSPIQYVQRRRLERACWMLGNPYLRIHEVAAACGYEDVNYFTRLFRRRYKVSPGLWRKNRLSPTASIK